MKTYYLQTTREKGSSIRKVAQYDKDFEAEKELRVLESEIKISCRRAEPPTV